MKSVKGQPIKRIVKVRAYVALTFLSTMQWFFKTGSI